MSINDGSKEIKTNCHTMTDFQNGSPQVTVRGHKNTTHSMMNSPLKMSLIKKAGGKSIVTPKPEDQYEQLRKRFDKYQQTSKLSKDNSIKVSPVRIQTELNYLPKFYNQTSHQSPLGRLSDKANLN